MDEGTRRQEVAAQVEQAALAANQTKAVAHEMQRTAYAAANGLAEVLYSTFLYNCSSRVKGEDLLLCSVGIRPVTAVLRLARNHMIFTLPWRFNFIFVLCPVTHVQYLYLYWYPFSRKLASNALRFTRGCWPYQGIPGKKWCRSNPSLCTYMHINDCLFLFQISAIYYFSHRIDQPASPARDLLVVACRM